MSREPTPPSADEVTVDFLRQRVKELENRVQFRRFPSAVNERLFLLSMTLTNSIALLRQQIDRGLDHEQGKRLIERIRVEIRVIGLLEREMQKTGVEVQGEAVQTSTQRALWGLVSELEAIQVKFAAAIVDETDRAFAKAVEGLNQATN